MGGNSGDPDDTGPDDTGDEVPYLTVAGPGERGFVVRGSEFLGYVASAATVADAEATVEARSEAYADATHNVPAYRVREGDLLREYGDDAGEPSGSAGKPALGVLQGRDLENVVAVVTRYYGGTNLGIGGLARAYSRAVKEAVEDAGVVERRPHERVGIVVEYDDSGTVRGILESEAVAFDADYRERVSFDVQVPVADCEGLLERIRSATSGRAVIDRDEGD